MRQQAERDEAREARFHDEIMVDAYNEEEKALSWYYYLEEHLHFPFQARCIAERASSPLRQGEVVTVTGMLPEDEFEYQVLVMAEWQGRTFGVPLAQLEGIGVDASTRQAIGDWHYWVEQGYQF